MTNNRFGSKIGFNLVENGHPKTYHQVSLSVFAIGYYEMIRMACLVHSRSENASQSLGKLLSQRRLGEEGHIRDLI